MRRLTVCVALAAVVATGGQPAQAGSDSEYTGQCYVDYVADQVAGQGQFTGEVHGSVTVFSRGTLTDNLVRARLTCWVQVNGFRQVGSFASDTGSLVIWAASLATFTSASLDDVIEVCTEVDYLSNTTPTQGVCFPA